MSFAVIGITDWADKGDHMASDIALGEAGASVRKQVVPFALEGFVIRTVLQCRIVLGEMVLREISFQSATPFSESTWIVWIREREEALRKRLGSWSGILTGCMVLDSFEGKSTL